MKNLKNNIDHYMNLKGIKMYSHLLVNIAHELGIKGQDAYDYANNEKSNFSKMLNGKRQLKYDFIIPLEKIFGVSLARLLDEDAYKLPVEKENVPFNKGFRYYAYLDDPILYKNEFDLLLASDGKSIINQTDEFEKTFLDYVVEYHSVNGVRYLHDEYGIKLRFCDNQFEFRKDKGITWINFQNGVEFARLVASMNDVELFNSIYDSYYMFFSCGVYPDTCIFCKDDFLELLLDNENIFKSIFEEKEYVYELNEFDKRTKNIESNTYRSINPIINNCLIYALKHLDKYRQQAIMMLKFGINYNRKNSSNKKFKDEDYYKLIVFADVETNDNEIKELILQLSHSKMQLS